MAPPLANGELEHKEPFVGEFLACNGTYRLIGFVVLHDCQRKPLSAKKRVEVSPHLGAYGLSDGLLVSTGYWSQCVPRRLL